MDKIILSVLVLCSLFFSPCTLPKMSASKATASAARG